MKLVFRVDFDSKDRELLSLIIRKRFNRRLNSLRRNLVELQLVMRSQDATHDNSCVELRVAASLRGRGSCRHSGQMSHCVLCIRFSFVPGNGRAAWNKGKGVFKTRRFLPKEKK